MLRARLLLVLVDFQNAVLHRGSHCLMHAVVVGTFDEVRRPAVAAQQAFQFLVRDSRQQRRVVDLVAVEVKDRQYRAVALRVQELVDVPGSRQWPGLRFAVSNHRRHDQIGIVVRGATGVREHVAQFPAFMDRTGRLRRAVAADAAGKRELLEELAQPFEVLALVGINLGVRAFEITRSENAGRAVAGPGQKDHVEVVLLDQPVQVHVDKRQSRARSPMAEQPVLDVLGL